MHCILRYLAIFHGFITVQADHFAVNTLVKCLLRDNVVAASSEYNTKCWDPDRHQQDFCTLIQCNLCLSLFDNDNKSPIQV